MFWTIVGAILFIWVLYKVVQKILRKLHDPIGHAKRIIENRKY